MKEFRDWMIILLVVILLTLAGTSVAEEKVPAPAWETLQVDMTATAVGGESAAKQADPNKGSVTITMSDMLFLDKANGVINLSYEHAAASSHVAVVQVIIVHNGEEILLGQSGLIMPGSTLNSVEALPDCSRLGDGVHNVVMRLLFYDAVTGQRADFNTDIPSYLGV